MEKQRIFRKHFFYHKSSLTQIARLMMNTFDAVLRDFAAENTQMTSPFPVIEKIVKKTYRIASKLG